MPRSADHRPVLIVDDDPALLRTMGDILRLRGFDPSVAQTGREALELAALTHPAVALVDLRLPDMDGLDLIGRLHSAESLTEVVVLTGNASITSAVRALREQIFDYLLKPVSPDQLVATLDRAGERWGRRRAEAALAATEQRYRSLIENAADPVAILDERGVIRYASPAYQRALGYPAEALVGTDVFLIVHQDDVSTLRDGMQAILPTDGATTPLTLRFRRHDGSFRTLAGTVKNLVGDPAIRGVVLNSCDVTERVALEAQLRQAQKIEAVGQLAGGIAHDLNNMLTAILSFSQFASGSLPPGHEAREDIEQVQLAAQRAASLTRQLLTFSRRQVLQPRPIDVGDVVRGMEPMLRRLISADISCVTRLASSRLSVMADPTQIEQVLLNLVLNGRDAMSDGGSLVIETRHVDIDEDAARGQPGAEPGPHVMLSVTDTGIGMDAETQARVFEPFFTTKPAGRGTGLGLSTVYSIVRQSGGSIRVRSVEGQGATFEIYLPAIDAVVEMPTAAAHASSTELRPMTILVVDDDAAVRRAAARALERDGHRVLVATNGREALALAEQHGRSIDLVLSDLVMPDMGGWDLGIHIAERWPGVSVLLMSGYNDRDAGCDVSLLGDDFLQKPFTVDGLLEKVRHAVRHRESRIPPPRAAKRRSKAAG